MQESRDQRAHELDTARLTQKKNPSELKLCDQVFHHLSDGFSRLPSPYTWTYDWQSATLLLATLGYNSLRWALELLLKGYYGQANALSRQAWECWLNAAYLLLHPDKLDDWRRRPPAPREMRKLVAERVAEQSGEAEAFRSKLWDVYSNYSAYAHPSDVSAGVLWAKDGDQLNLRLGGEYDDALIVQSADMFTQAGEMLFTLLYVLIPDDAEYETRGGAIRGGLAEWRKEIAGR